MSGWWSMKDERGVSQYKYSIIQYNTIHLHLYIQFGMLTLRNFLPVAIAMPCQTARDR